MSASSTTMFPPIRSLLYPQFETYRLHSLSPTDDVIGYPLPGSGATQSRLEHGSHTLSFKETRDRIGWDHLAVDGSGRGVYVDKEWNIVGFVLDDNLTPTFSLLGAIPQPISSAPSSSALAPEYPCVAPLQPGFWAVSSGSGSLYILETSGDHNSGAFTAMYHLPSDTSSPFLIRGAHVQSEADVRLLLSRAVPDPADTQTKGRRSMKRVFEMLEVSIDMAAKGDVDEGRPMEVKWTLQGGDLPVHCAWAERGGWLVLSAETYGPANGVRDEEMLNDAEREKKERDARIGKLGLGASLPSSTPDQDPVPPQPTSPTPPPDQPLSWTQTGGSASIRIPFTAGTVRSDMNISLNPSMLCLSVRSGPPQPILLQQFLQYTERSWWADIDPSLSSFSYDPSSSTLDIDLTKVDSNYRWPSLFLPSGSDDDDAEIPESLTADTLAAVRETFNNIRTRGSDEPEGNHPAIPSLLREEMEFDMEDGEDFEDRAAGAMGDGGGKVGREVFVGVLTDGQARWSKGSTTVVSLPLQAGGAEGGIIVKSAVDGLLFGPSADPTNTPWLHQATIPALAFVLSSKRDIRLVRHFNPSSGQHPTVLAFDSGSSSAGQGNVYVYYPPTDQMTARQGVVRVSGLERGAALGVAIIRKESGDVVVVLCEKELVVLTGVV